MGGVLSPLRISGVENHHQSKGRASNGSHPSYVLAEIEFTTLKRLPENARPYVTGMPRLWALRKNPQMIINIPIDDHQTVAEIPNLATKRPRLS